MSDPTTTLNLARTQIGVHSPNNMTPYNVEYGMSGPGAAWCQMFVWWVLSHSGVQTIRTAWTPSGIAYYEGLGRWTSGANLEGARPGDVIYFDYDNYAGQRTDHVGFIEAIDASNVTTIEGNVDGGYVRRKTHRRGAGYIVGYGRPLYEAAAPQVDLAAIARAINDSKRQTLRQGSRGGAVKWLQIILNDRTGAGLTVDGVFGPMTDRAVRAYQRSRGLVVDGIVGPRTWGSLVP